MQNHSLKGYLKYQHYGFTFLNKDSEYIQKQRFISIVNLIHLYCKMLRFSKSKNGGHEPGLFIICDFFDNEYGVRRGSFY